MVTVLVLEIMRRLNDTNLFCLSVSVFLVYPSVMFSEVCDKEFPNGVSASDIPSRADLFFDFIAMPPILALIFLTLVAFFYKRLWISALALLGYVTVAIVQLSYYADPIYYAPIAEGCQTSPSLNFLFTIGMAALIARWLVFGNLKNKKAEQ